VRRFSAAFSALATIESKAPINRRTPNASRRLRMLFNSGRDVVIPRLGECLRMRTRRHSTVPTTRVAPPDAKQGRSGVSSIPSRTAGARKCRADR
jgi:hypothetical protein